MFDNIPDVKGVSEEDLDIALGKEPEDNKKVETSKKADDPKNQDNLDNKGNKNQSKDNDSDNASTGIANPLNDLSDDDLEEVDDDDETDDEDSTKEDKKESDENKSGKGKDGNDKKDDLKGELSTENVLKSHVDYLISQGLWRDIEGKDDITWTEDEFASMVEQQQQALREEIREEVLEGFGPYGKSIAQYAENGGDPSKLISLFKEQQKAAILDITTEDGQKAVLYKYFTEVGNAKPAAAKKMVEVAVAENTLAIDAKEYKSEIEKVLEDKRIEEEEAQAQWYANQKKEQEAFWNKYVTETNSAIDAQEISADEKNILKKYLTKAKVLQDGRRVNEFAFKWAEFSKDKSKFIDVVRFVLDPEKFKQSLKTEAKNQANKRAFSLVRTGNKNKSASTEKIDKDTKQTQKKSTFKLMY